MQENTQYCNSTVLHSQNNFGIDLRRRAAPLYTQTHTTHTHTHFDTQTHNNTKSRCRPEATGILFYRRCQVLYCPQIYSLMLTLIRTNTLPIKTTHTSSRTQTHIVCGLSNTCGVLKGRSFTSFTALLNFTCGVLGGRWWQATVLKAYACVRYRRLPWRQVFLGAV
jgi:hypothetical protein